MKIDNMDRLNKWYFGELFTENEILFYTRGESGKQYPVAAACCSCCEEPRFPARCVKNPQKFIKENQNIMKDERNELTFHEETGYICKYCYSNGKLCKNGCGIIAVEDGLCRDCYIDEDVKPSIDAFIYKSHDTCEWEIQHDRAKELTAIGVCDEDSTESA